MNAMLGQWLGGRADHVKGVIAPLFVVLVLAMMVLPLPPLMLDVLFTFNIAIALTVMMVAARMVRPLDFAAFPTVLLITTLLRLSLNVASTRVVLMQGHTGAAAAGEVIESFGHFLIGGNFAVGLIVFAILVVINFIVVTKGAERIAEVGARFTLDAMPGKQMAIDADLNAGLIDEKEAKRRRLEVSEEAEFFGSMDGASKFVRGDAVAGILILVINIVGIGILRELGPMLASIISAGRSGSAVTAQLGVMRVTEEVEALAVMGISITTRLVLPRVLGLAVALPLVTFCTDIAALGGAMVVCDFTLGISPGAFLQAVPRAVDVVNFWIGIGKAAAFGFAVAFIACHYGLRVLPNTDSLAVGVTRSVVASITCVIILDALFAVLLRNVG